MDEKYYISDEKTLYATATGTKSMIYIMAVLLSILIPFNIEFTP
jgi:hypothetical protein